MLNLIKQVFSLATKCLSINDEPRMVRPNLVDLNSVELKYYPFMISLNKCNGSFNVLMSYLQKYVFHIKQKT